MKKGLTEVVFLLDRSGSMRGLESDTIGGFNSLIEKQKREEGEAYISTVLFDDQTEVLYDRVPLKQVEAMTREQYYVRGCTALHDALGGAIHHIGNVHKYAREEDVPEKTLFIITTDGLENASRFYSCDQVKQMVERQKNRYGWEFLFLGANMDAIQEAGRFGISPNRAVTYECDGQGTRNQFFAVSASIAEYRKAESKEDEECALRACLASIEEDYKERHGKNKK